MLPRDPDAREEMFYTAQLRIIELLEQLVDTKEVKHETVSNKQSPNKNTNTSRSGVHKRNNPSGAVQPRKGTSKL